MIQINTKQSNNMKNTPLLRGVILDKETFFINQQFYIKSQVFELVFMQTLLKYERF